MSYTTTTEIQLVLGADYKAGADLTQPLKEAGVVMARLVTCSTLRGVTLSTTELEVIEANLAAHFYTTKDRQYTSRSTEGASGSFAGTYGEGFKASSFGQKALALDPSGCLLAMETGGAAGGVWLGKRATDRRSYRERNYD